MGSSNNFLLQLNDETDHSCLDKFWYESLKWSKSRGGFEIQKIFDTLLAIICRNWCLQRLCIWIKNLFIAKHLSARYSKLCWPKFSWRSRFKISQNFCSQERRFAADKKGRYLLLPRFVVETRTEERWNQLMSSSLSSSSSSSSLLSFSMWSSGFFINQCSLCPS